ncbi:Endopolyphosphatase [Candida viswanathii]|uniref:Endopolyphosphatase n=1 Tax=Candida viswanathii TaxID=5486 RepID=A0A367YIQ1_9ASCO|nr:Endopolyphosphatase [Candida viswanathii]
MEEKIPQDNQPQQLAQLKWSRVSVIKYLGVAVLSVFTLLSYFQPQLPYITTQQVHQYVSARTIDLNATQVDELKRLGLTPKKPVQIETHDGRKMTIHGRFLHLTDLHIDHHYKEGADFDEVCHSGKGKSGKYGDAILGCDSPPILVDETFRWIKENLKDKVDFIVYTGDSARHDNDRNYPRTAQKIFEMNLEISERFEKLFEGDDENPEDEKSLEQRFVPNPGNNDFFGKLVDAGNSERTRFLFQAWRPFIPSEQMHTYLQGAYHFLEVIPNQLAILSLNSMFWFNSNPMVDDCDTKTDAGYQLFEWLGYVLKEMRARNMKVWLIGHVPPNEKNYDISCLRKYTVWTHEYRDVIIGGIYGHMNLDHFIPYDSVKAYKSIRKDFKDLFAGSEVSAFDANDEDDVAIEDSQLYKSLDEKFSDGFFRVTGGVPKNKVDYMETLREDLYAPLKGKKKSGEYFERYSVSHVGASVIPTFNPGLRVWEYNITNLATEVVQVKFEPWNKFFAGVEKLVQMQAKYEIESEDEVEISKKKKKKHKKKKKDHTFPKPMPLDRPLGPAYIEQTYTPERYVQYYADLELINKGKKDFGYEIEYSTDDALYGLNALTVKEWITYGRKLGKPIKDASAAGKKKKGKKKKGKKKHTKLNDMWHNYLKNTFVSSDYENKGYG